MVQSPKGLHVRLAVAFAVSVVLAGIVARVGLWRRQNSAEPTGPRGPRMIRIPGGTYYPGAPVGVDAGVLQKAVTLPDFEMDETEVTVDQYAQCVDAGKCKPAITNEAEPENRLVDVPVASEECNYRHRTILGNHPINCVNSEMADAFCTWAGKRLPTVDEWEYAARGTDGRRYPWGNQEPDSTHLNACGTETVDSPLIKDIRHKSSKTFPWNDGYPLTSPVRSFPEGRSPFGLYAMAGNVVEIAFDDKGGGLMVLLGGSWAFDSMELWLRNGGLGSLGTSEVGIRCARSVQSTDAQSS